MSEKFFGNRTSPKEKSIIESKSGDYRLEEWHERQAMLEKAGWRRALGTDYLKDIFKVIKSRVNSTKLPEGVKFQLMNLGEFDEPGDWLIKRGWESQPGDRNDENRNDETGAFVYRLVVKDGEFCGDISSLAGVYSKEDIVQRAVEEGRQKEALDQLESKKTKSYWLWATKIHDSIMNEPFFLHLYLTDRGKKPKDYEPTTGKVDRAAFFVSKDNGKTWEADNRARTWPQDVKIIKTHVEAINELRKRGWKDYIDERSEE